MKLSVPENVESDGRIGEVVNGEGVLVMVGGGRELS